MLPDVVGFTLDEARIKLLNAGVEIERVDVTAPPKEKSSEFDDYYRVIRVKSIDSNKVELLVCKPL